MAAAGGRASRSLKKAVVKHPAYASWGSVVNAQVKAKLTPSSKCNLGKFLGIRDPPASDVSLTHHQVHEAQQSSEPWHEERCSFGGEVKVHVGRQRESWSVRDR
ncbi:hypothetical protein OIU74_020764 [Salix koriyanagi]|uniref:Uncharacterized protein n=1 Tax=Salix koriyanagi TaxID=2511006 RepID=A0A9Q0P6S7_9ROSI|nr:hypothetical protein OIU74_020764 [Salix koriyanagi]